jgi:hypothetical protein
MLPEADETASAIDELATEMTDSAVPCEDGAAASLSLVTFFATFLAAAAAAAGTIFVLKSSVESSAAIFQRPVSFRRASSFAASSAMVIA